MFKHIVNRFYIFVKNYAALLIIGGCFCGSLQKIFVKSYLNQIDVFIIVFYQYLFGLIFYLPKIVKSKGQLLITKKFFLIALRAILGVVYWFGIVLSLKYVPLLDTIFLTSMTPIWVPFLAYFFFSERLNKKFYFFIFIGLLGIAFILKPDANIINIGAIPALISGVAWASSILLIAKLTKTEKIETVLIYYFLIASIVTAPFVIFYQSNLNAHQIIGLAINAALMVFHQELINRGFSYPNAYKLSVLTYINIIFSGLFGIIFFKEVPSLRSLIGMLFIFYSCLYITLKVTKNELKQGS